MKSWFQFKNLANDPSVVEIHIIDFIGDWWDDAANRFWGESFGVTAKAFIEKLASLPDSVKAIHVHINSPGGDVAGGINIANALRAQAETKGRAVETFIDGMAASIASVIAMAGSKVHMADNALLMIHNASALAWGNSEEMRKCAEILDTMNAAIAKSYRWHSSLEESELLAMMAAETWMDVDQAISKGFVTDKVEGLQAAAQLDPRSVAKMRVPDQYRARVDAFLQKPAPAPVAAEAVEVLRLCREGGVSDLAEGLIGAKATLEAVAAAVAAEKTTREEASAVSARAAAEETERVNTIRAMCKAAHRDDLAEWLIAGHITADAAGKTLATVKALLDQHHIDGSLGANGGAKAKPVLDTQAIYAERNAPAK